MNNFYFRFLKKKIILDIFYVKFYENFCRHVPTRALRSYAPGLCCWNRLFGRFVLNKNFDISYPKFDNIIVLYKFRIRNIKIFVEDGFYRQTHTHNSLNWLDFVDTSYNTYSFAENTWKLLNHWLIVLKTHLILALSNS